MQTMHQVWRPSGPLGSRLNCAIFFSCRQCTQTRSAGPSVLPRFDGRSSCRHSHSAQLVTMSRRMEPPHYARVSAEAPAGNVGSPSAQSTADRKLSDRC